MRDIYAVCEACQRWVPLNRGDSIVRPIFARAMRSKSRTSLWMRSISAEWMIRPSKGSATAASKHECLAQLAGQFSAAVH
jgi:hypothetical protein